MPILTAILAIAAVSALVEPKFMAVSSLRSILLWVPLVIVVAMGQMLVIVTRGIDVSAGAMMGLSGMTMGILFREMAGLNVAVGVLAGVGVGGLLGAVNGTLVVWGRVPPIVATLGTLGVYRGLVHIVSRGVQVNEYELPRALGRWAISGPFGQTLVPWIVVVSLVAAVLTALGLRFTRLGRDIFAVGGNPDAARLRGIAVGRVTFLVYVASGLASGMGGVMYASRFGTINPASIGFGFELIVISAVVVGGVSILGGRGSVAGVVLGSLLLATIYTALTVADVATAWQVTSYGVAILLAVIFDEVVAKRTGRTTA
jgi:rhamnose transport system permease protein